MRMMMLKKTETTGTPAHYLARPLPPNDVMRMSRRRAVVRIE